MKKISHTYLYNLVEIDGNHFLHTIFDVLRGKEMWISPPLNLNLPEVLQKDWTYGFGGVRHVDGAIVATHLSEVG